MRRLCGEDERFSALEIKLKDPAASDIVTARLTEKMGAAFAVKDRLQQHAFLYRIILSEKVAVYAILGFILLIAVFNLFGTLTMLILDKRPDLQTLYVLGADLQLARRIFLLEGLLISVGGALTGIVLGALICGVQQMYGIIKIGGGDGFLTEAYPVSMRAGDFVLVALVVFVIGFTASAYTSGVIVKRQSDPRLSA
jgi:lipoprotein-releasing system permease protein